MKLLHQFSDGRTGPAALANGELAIIASRECHGATFKDALDKVKIEWSGA